MPIPETLSKTILQLIGLPDLTGPEAERRVRAVLDDGQMLLLGQKLASRAFIVDALREAGPGQISVLVKRTAGPAALVVRFTVAINPRNGFATLTASLMNPSPSGNSNHTVATVIDQQVFDGPPENILAWEFHGQRCDRRTAEEYARCYEPHFALRSGNYQAPGRSRSEIADEAASQITKDRQAVAEAERPKYAVSPELFKALGKSDSELAEEKESAKTLARQREHEPQV